MKKVKLVFKGSKVWVKWIQGNYGRQPWIELRTLLQVKYSNGTKAKSKKDQDLIQVLMGDEVGPRKNFIINRALEVSNLDI